MTGTMPRRTTVSLTKEQYEALRRLASEKHTSVSRLVRDTVLEMLEDEEDIREGLKALQNEEGTVTLKQYERGKL